MIRYEGKENKYFYNPQDVERILEIIGSSQFYNIDNCTQENVTALVNEVDSFMAHIRVEKQAVILERHETEEEARKYFGEYFIHQFDQLLTTLDKQKTIVFLHGTSINVCPEICETGLQYKSPSLESTAVCQHMAYGQRDMHYQNYESLLNWGHKNYKGLVIIAVPYECYYKEGLWNHFRDTFQDTEVSVSGIQDYKIDSDFIVGYLDIEGKNIVMNPKYNRQHHYEGYDKDNDLFREKKEMNNDKFTQLLIETDKEFEKLENSAPRKQVTLFEKKKKIDISRISYIIEDLIGIFNSMKIDSSDGISESRYQYLLEQLSDHFDDIKKILPFLKTNEQVRREEDEKFSMFSQPSQLETNLQTEVSSDESNFDWGEDIDWTESSDQERRFK